MDYGFDADEGWVMSNALDDLIAKVEAGLDTAHHHAAVFPSESAGGHCTWHDSHKASNGSLDAALSLHKAVLPRWGFTLYGGFVEGENYGAIVGMAPKGEARKQMSGDAENPARAWLLAILRAMKDGKDA